jgi:hypothetical protein
MAATFGTLLCVGKSGRTYSVDMAVPDAAAGIITFNQSGLAATTSPNNFRAPEDITIVDFVILAAPTAVGAALNINGGVVNGGALRMTNQLASLANRAKLKIGVRAGDFIGFTNF